MKRRDPRACFGFTILNRSLRAASVGVGRDVALVLGVRTSEMSNPIALLRASEMVNTLPSIAVSTSEPRKVSAPVIIMKGKLKIEPRMEETVALELERRSSVQTVEVWPFSEILKVEFAKAAKHKYSRATKKIPRKEARPDLGLVILIPAHLLIESVPVFTWKIGMQFAQHFQPLPLEELAYEVPKKFWPITGEHAACTVLAGSI